MLTLLGIRHHGPGSARSVLAALDEVQPDVVLIESPSETTAALAWIGNGLVPPVALLGYVVDQPQRAAFMPFAEFSPEWQAVAWANERGVPVQAIDLPLANSLATGLHRNDDNSQDNNDDADNADNADNAHDDTVDANAPTLFGDGRPADPIGALAAAAGQPDAERWWEDVIEHRGDGLVTFRAVAEAMAAVRAGAVSSPRELQREAFMRKTIRAARKVHERVAVVCGAWHVPALDLDGELTSTDGSATATRSIVANSTTDAATLRGLPKVKVAVSWVPWTDQRLAAESGYGAGVDSPGWYAHVFAHPGDAAPARFFVDAARVLRQHDLPASPDHLIAATRLTDTLAAMRDRPRPGLAEVLDAADAVMGGLPLVEREIVVGTGVGEVPAAAPQVPLARDLAKRQKSARLAVTAEEAIVELDLRTPNGLRRSHLLHQLNALDIGWGTLQDGRGSSGTFRETWRLVWSPEFSVRVVERAGYGTTVEHAATRKLIDTARRSRGLVELAAALDLALLADLTDAVDDIVVALERRAARDPDVVALMGALSPLAQARRYGDVRSTDADAIASVFDGIVVRVLAGLVGAVRSLDDDAAAAIVEQLSQTQQALALVDHPARHGAFPAVLRQIAQTGVGHGLVQGRATRLLHDSGDWSQEIVGQRLGQALSGGTPPAAGAAFVEGFLAGSGTVLLHDAGLRSIIDAWLASLRPEAFDMTVPLLRRTFGGFASAERRQLARLLTGHQVEIARPFGDDLDHARLLAVTETVRRMVGVPV